jgi:molybdopterin-guanine dinucleotide biosynthesis protein A
MMKNTRFGIKNNIAAAILAGGKSKRFGGSPKGLLKIDSETTIIGKILSEISKTGIKDCIICANDVETYSSFNIRIIQDNFGDKGPIAGIESALNHFVDEFEAVLFVPVDLPNFSSMEINVLLENFLSGKNMVTISETPDFLIHPLCSVVNVKMLEVVRKAIYNNHLKIRKLWKDVDVDIVHFDSQLPFININTPDDYHNMLKLDSDQIQSKSSKINLKHFEGQEILV